MADEESREFPTGEAKKLGELAREKWREHFLLFSQVKNTVLEVNPNVNLPFNLEKGKSSSLGLFAEAAFREKPGKFPKGKHALEVWPAHKRSAILGRIIFNDTEGRIYRDIDIKGIGAVVRPETTAEVSAYVGFRRYGGEREGLLDCDSAFFDRQASEEFLQAGIRTYRVLAIIELKEIIANQQKLSLSEAIREGIIDKDFRPVVEVRAFGVKTRIEDLSFMKSFPEEKRLLLEDAKKVVSQELGYKKPFSIKEYFVWFAKTLGRNIGLMHKNGWRHEYLGCRFHNITLDCRIVDLDSVTRLKSEVYGKEDVEDALTSFMGGLIGSFSSEVDYSGRQALEQQFLESYDSVFPPEERKRYFNRVSKEK